MWTGAPLNARSLTTTEAGVTEARTVFQASPGPSMTRLRLPRISPAPTSPRPLVVRSVLGFRVSAANPTPFTTYP